MTFPTTVANEPAPRVSMWRRRRGDDDRRTSLLFWLTVFGMGVVATLTVTWGASAVLAQKGDERLLRLDLHFPKLKNIQRDWKAFASHTSEPHPSSLAQPKDRTTPPPPPLAVGQPKAAVVQPLQSATVEPPLLASEPKLHLIPPVEVAPPIETCDEPAAYMHPCTPQRGDSPMTRNWKTLTMYSLLSAAAVAFVPQPAVLFAEEKKPAPAKADGLDDLDTSIKALTKRIAALEGKKLADSDKEAIAEILRKELKTFEEGPLAKLNRNLDTLQAEQKNHQLRLEQHKFMIDQLTKRFDTPTTDKAVLETLKAIQDGLAKLGPIEKRTMAYSGNGTSATQGRVMLVNHYGDELLFIINGVGHRVPASTSKLVEGVPVGAVGVEVFSTRFGVFHRQGTTLAGGDTFTLTANPPR